MKLTIILFGLVVFTGSLAKDIRIVGGENTIIHNVPHQVSIRIYDLNQHFCSGSIITRYHILSAAHCFNDMNNDYTNLRVYIGTNSPYANSGVRFKITKVDIHPEFTGRMTQDEAWIHDIAVVTVDKRIKFQPYQHKIDLPTDEIVIGSDAVITGYGKLNFSAEWFPDQIHKAVLTVIDIETCMNQLNRRIHDTQACLYKAKGIGGCYGDSGGPVVANEKLIGIQSWVIPCAQGYPDVFTNVYSHLDFINSIIGSTSTPRS
ncbi:PREDICTED: chymotrypsin-2-like [Ceratosolen solmsi marchali]|uniref:Chymotrypsin-2-like n=1 Tax=Ceratosolen solmsi marchali TaxID=326594 RepID=A0AAJ6YF68_9HYME|nr:PREDICTED: chymotrypsin-2-like [Ceratosolen solmsi marchali]